MKIRDYCDETYEVDKILVKVNGIEQVLKTLCSEYKRIGDIHICILECSAYAFKVEEQ